MTTSIRPHLFMREPDGPGCRYCGLPKRNSRFHLDPDALSVPDITEPSREPVPLATQLVLPKPRSARARRRKASA